MDTKNKVIKKYIHNIKETSYNSVMGKLNKTLKKKGLNADEKKNTKNIVKQLQKWKSNESKKNEKEFQSSLKEFKKNLENDFNISVTVKKSSKTKSNKSTKSKLISKSKKLKKININNKNSINNKKMNTKLKKKEKTNKSNNIKIKEFTNKEIINLIKKN